MHIVEFLIGFLIVVAVLLDVFGTVVVPRASQNHVRISIMIGRFISPLWLRLTERVGNRHRRQHLNGSLGPALLLMALASWIVALAIGFALMLVAQPQNVAMDQFGFAEALYQSTLALSTLGMLNADLNGAARAVVAVAGVAGFTTISLVVAFLLAVQSALHRRETMVLALPARAGHPPSPTRILENVTGDFPLAEFFSQWEGWIADVWQTHLSYPVLCRFRSLDEDMEWIVCLGAVLDAAAFVVATRPDGMEHAIARAGFLLTTGESAITALHTLLGGGAEVAGERAGRFSTLQAQATREAMGGPVDTEAAEDRFEVIRQRYAPNLKRLAARLGIPWAEAT